MLGLKLAVGTGGRLQQFAQFACGADPSAVERVEDQPLGTVRQTDKKMAREGEPDSLPALGAAGVHVENAERHRQALPAVDDAHQVRVLQVVIGQRVAGIPVFQKHDLVEGAGSLGDIAGRRGMAADIAREQLQMLAVARRADPRAFERGERQGRLGDRQDAFARSAELTQKICASLWIVSLRRLDHPSLISEFVHLDSGRRRGGRRRVGHLRAGGWRRRSRLGGDGCARPDLDVRHDPLHIRDVPCRLGDAVELRLGAGRPDQVHRSVHRIDRVIDRADLAGKNQVRADLGGDPGVLDARPGAFAGRHLDLVIDRANPRDLARDLRRLSLQLGARRHAGQQSAPFIDGDREIALHQRVHL